MFLALALILLGSFSSFFASAVELTKNVTDCSCGFYDHSTQNLFTESAIVYFNETKDLPAEVFAAQHYEHTDEKGWNTLYRQGANISNVQVGRGVFHNASNSSLELFVDPSTPAHLVVGGGVKTVRQDLFYGSFRTLLRSPAAPGSSLSMDLAWNDTQAITMNLQSTDWPWTAWVSTLNGDEFPDRKYGVNYTVLANESISPWDYTEYRVDWSPNEVNWTVGGKLVRSLQEKSGDEFPQTPVPLVLKHWSVGNWFSMQGPPVNRTLANVGWVRLFFNSSLTSDEARQEFTSRCHLKDACAMDDVTLRGASPYGSAATLKWKQTQKPRGKKEAATAILIICGSVSFLLISNALARRVPWDRLARSKPAIGAGSEHNHPATYALGSSSDEAICNCDLTPPDSRAESFYGRINGGSIRSSTPYVVSRRPSSEIMSVHMTASTPDEEAKEKHTSSRISWRDYSAGHREAQPYTPSCHSHTPSESGTGYYIKGVQESSRLYASSKGSAMANNKTLRTIVSVDPVIPTPTATVVGAHHTSKEAETAYSEDSVNVDIAWRELKALNSARAQAAAPSSMPIQKQRVDYLAGLVALSCLLVTGIHFCLTFTPAAINPVAYVHYDSETWARKTIDAYLLNLIWIGPFLMTSTHFLVSGYLTNGDLAGVAEKAMGRPFRLIVPVFAIAMLEYFFMDSGATQWLEHLPSVTWSSWPFTTVPHTFGNFLSEILELAYLIPNAAPQITFNFCTGALFTIPVQLQGTWVTLLAVIVIRHIKRPWKRFGFYTFCILMHWYALSWGTYFYLALMLADLDITFKYRKWLKAHSLTYSAIVVLFAAMAFGALSLDMITQWTGVNYVGFEYGIHPDIPTGKPIMNTGAIGYPQYYVPKAHGVLFAFGIQALVELSPLVQKFFTMRVFIWLFPHIFTIYLIHGFIFWSLGSAICVALAGRGMPYWANVLIVAACCYTILFASLPLLTPIIDQLGRHVTANIWQFAHETPAPRRPTLYPFPENFLFVRQNTEQEGEQEVEKHSSNDSLATRQRSPFQKFLSNIVATLTRSQPAEPASTCGLQRSSSAGGRSVTPRKVGWRAGRLSGNVEVLRGNNSSAKNNKPT